jgi:hypothetical protein
MHTYIRYDMDVCVEICLIGAKMGQIMTKLAYQAPWTELDDSDKADIENIHATMDESDGYAYLGDSYTDHMWDDGVQWLVTRATRINFALVHEYLDSGMPGNTDSSKVSVIDDDPVRWDNWTNSNVATDPADSDNSDKSDNQAITGKWFAILAIPALVAFGAMMGLLDVLAR